MASVNSKFRKLVKPLLFKLLGERGYIAVQTRGKIKDIEGRLVEEKEMALFPDLFGEDAVVLDIGANYAYHSHRMALQANKGKVYAFEPIPFTHAVCKRIIKHYGLKNVELFQKGVGAKNETLTFEVPLQEFGAASAGQAHLGGRDNSLEGKEQHYKFSSHQEVKCEVITIDSFLPDLERLDFVKMDIEGAEYFALQGMKASLQKFQPPILMEINPFFLKGFGIAESDLAKLIDELGYQLYLYDATNHQLKEFKEAYREENYVLLHQDRLAAYQKLIKDA